MIRRLAPLAAVLSVLALLGGGCSSAGDKASEKAIEKSIEKNGEDVDVDVDGDEVKVETSDGTLTAGTGELPEGYPKDDVPVVDGEILVGVVAADQGYSVSVKVDGDAQSAFDDAVAKLEDAGLSTEEDGGMFGPQSAALTGNGYSVLLTASEAGGQTTVTYIVSKD